MEQASDGPAMIANAYTKGSPRAVAHRSHSGHFGLVNSESGYQNLRRLLFGSLRIKAVLYVERVDLPLACRTSMTAGPKFGVRTISIHR